MATKLFRWVPTEDLLQDEVVQCELELPGYSMLPAITADADILLTALLTTPVEIEPWMMIDTMNHLPIY